MKLNIKITWIDAETGKESLEPNERQLALLADAFKKAIECKQSENDADEQSKAG
jgi:hypothetical protein